MATTKKKDVGIYNAMMLMLRRYTLSNMSLLLFLSQARSNVKKIEILYRGWEGKKYKIAHDKTFLLHLSRAATYGLQVYGEGEGDRISISYEFLRVRRRRRWIEVCKHHRLLLFVWKNCVMKMSKVHTRNSYQWNFSHIFSLCNFV